MNRKQLILILAALVVLGGLGLWLRSRDVGSYRTSSGAMGQKVLGEFDINTVTRVVVRQGTNSLTLSQKDDGWVVAERGEYPANFSEVGETLRKLWDLKIVQPVPGPLGASGLARLELDPAATNKPATVVELLDKDGKALRTLVLGKQHRRKPTTPSAFGDDEGWPDGRYVMLKDGSAGASLVSESFSSLEPKPESWLNRDFLKVEKPKSIAVTYPESTNSWRMTRASETNEWALADLQAGEQVDPTKTTVLSSVLSWPSFEDVVMPGDPALAALEKPTVAEIETTEGFKYAIKAAQKGAEEKYLMTVTATASYPRERTAGEGEKPEDKERLDKEFKERLDKLDEKLKKEKALDGRVFLVAKYTLDTLLKKRGDFFKEAKPEAAAEAGDLPLEIPAEVNPVDATLPPVPPLP